MEHATFDVIVIGSRAAGLRAVLYNHSPKGILIANLLVEV